MRRAFCAGGFLALSCSPGFAELDHTATYTGHVGAQIQGVAFDGMSSVTGSFSVSGIPAGATILSAFVHSNDWFSGGAPLTLVFDGSSSGPTAPFDVATSIWGELFDFRWDVTALVGGDGAYAFDVTGSAAPLSYFVSLVVVYEHASLPAASISIYEGAQQLPESTLTQTVTIPLPGAPAGPCTFHLVTQADDGTTSGETITYNGALVGGPLDANLGNYASLATASVTSNGSTDSVDIQTQGDLFGMHLAVVTGPAPEPGIPMCFGDGSGTTCPCGNDGGAGEGCANGTGSGGVLSASGTASVSADTLSLTADGVINDNGLFFQGDNTIAGGAGIVFGDGIRCCGGSVVRIQVVNPPGSTSPATATMTETATTNGLPGTITAGTKKCYQYWYRDPATSPCGVQFNLTNAVTVIWQP